VDSDMPQEPLPIPDAAVASNAAAPIVSGAGSVTSVAPETAIPEPAILEPAAMTYVSPTAATAQAAVPETVTYRERGGWLIAFGIVQILLGGMTALMTLFVMLSAVASRFTMHRAGNFKSQIGTIAFCMALAVGFVVFGVGSIRARRWARALTLVTSWYALIFGTMMTVLMAVVLPMVMRTSLNAQPKSSNVSPEFTMGIMAVVVTFMIVFMAVFLVALPLSYVIFYSRKDVILTCRQRDVAESWTERTPLPVLAASLALALSGLYYVLFGFAMPIFPYFGHYLTGVAGWTGLFLLGMADIAIAINLFRMKTAAWWAALLLGILRAVSSGFTFSRDNLIDAYSRTDMSEEQLQMIRANPMFRGHFMFWWTMIMILLSLAYLIWLKRYFKSPESPAQVEPGLSLA